MMLQACLAVRFLELLIRTSLRYTKYFVEVPLLRGVDNSRAQQPHEEEQAPHGGAGEDNTKKNETMDRGRGR